MANKSTATVTSITKKSKQPLAKLAKSTKKINAGGLNPDAIIRNNLKKTARAQHNAERHLTLDGKTVREALESRLVEAKDLRYDLSKDFICLDD